MRKKTATLAILALGAGLLSGCGGSNEGSSESGQTTPDGKVKLTALMTKHPLTQEFSKMQWLQEAEERAGVDIEWQEVSADWDQKKGALLAGGDVPDLIIGPNAITDADYAQFPGLFEDLTPLIASNAPNVQKMFEEKPETKAIATQLDGKIYGLPKYQRFWPETTTRQFINKQWLDNLGLKEPTNWDELYEVLLAFKEQDANGNGNPNDEIPMDFAPSGTGGFGAFMPTVLLGSQGITLTDNSGQGYFVEDGQVKNFFIDERYKDLVAFLHKCYAAGLINTEVFTQDYTKYQSVARGSGDTAAVGFTWGWEVTDRVGNALAPQYESLAPLKESASSTDELSWTYDYNSLNYGVNMVSLASTSKNKEAAVKFINELYDPEVSMQVLFGSIGTNIKDNGDGTYEVLPPEDSAMDPGTWKWTTTWADNGPMYIADSLELTLGTDMQSVGSQTEPLQDVLDSIDKEKDVLPSMFIKYSVEDNNAMSLNNTAMLSLTMSKWAEWITKGGVEEQWAGYVDNVKKTGIDRNIEIIQKYYDEYMSQN
ncbi:extracellular solute-binding protein [Saccharibacillus kuerlensis]|uniref:Sugar ABC transporter substrate-binding protein n=1 Tax=Saccharibacillus kuerlensis TaxID=459527 RepID=A0ABQ2KYG7_9BACL|nr:extracellular solute-binding protein [Saccharibacillus kuerlensis]GGN97056.1 sugar ABC transporter substrate-binding protein [Saccharibacillus kuerlensis]